ncbi:MAG: cobyrinate a,c-diamide synthase [bacterium]|nr:cobyrinate a,c-diamide synthase [bacterium]
MPRLVIAGLAGDSGKSLVSLGLIGALRNRGLTIAPFKKGPDFIDAAWLGAAALAPCRNLDTFMMPQDAILASLAEGSREAALAVVEGNRGLYDGMDAGGSHSTAQLAKLIGAPVVLVVDVTKSTRTVAAQVLGCRVMDPEVDIAGVILNRVGTLRQEKVIREAIAGATDVPVLGAIPRLRDQHLPSRHLGLVTAMEHPETRETLARVAALVAEHVDVPALRAVAGKAGELPQPAATPEASPVACPGVRIGMLQDRAFSFYYPENLRALEDRGAEIVEISPLDHDELPDLDGLYAGGGFPEEHAEALAANRPLREALRRVIDDGLPVWAECGGLMYLSRALVKDGQSHEMVGALPVVVEHTPRPQGHGYVEASADHANPFLAEGTELCGHEFHYSRLAPESEQVPTVFGLSRGIGVGGGRDGLRIANTVATYTHLHALATPAWADGLVRAAAGSPL